MRKITFISLLILSACSVIDQNRVAPGYFQAYEAIKNYFIGYENTEITPELIKNIPYASATIQIGNGPLGLMILESKNNFKEVWVTADEVYLEIRDGRIFKTQGLLNNLVDFRTIKEVLDLETEEKIYTSYYSYDLPALTNLKTKVRLKKQGKKLINLLNQTLELTLITEEINNNYLGWNVLNKYWLDDDGYIWKSEQHISPKLPAFKIEVTKRPSE